MQPLEGVSSHGRCLGSAGKAYLCYAHYGEIRNAFRPHYAVEKAKKTVAWRLQIPVGKYQAIWHDPKSGKELGRTTLDAGAAITTPEHSEDIALELRRL
jgi:hypothetical protein